MRSGFHQTRQALEKILAVRAAQVISMLHLGRARIVPARNRHLARWLDVDALLLAVRHDEHALARIQARDHHENDTRRRIERGDRDVVDHAAVEDGTAVASQDRRERRRARRLQDEIGEIFDRRALLRFHEFGMKTERLTERRVKRLADIFLDVVCDQPRRDCAARAEPARQMRHADANLGRVRELMETVREDVEQRLSIDAVMRKHGLPAQQVAPVGVARVVAQRVGVVVHDPARLVRVEHAGGGRTRRNTGDDARFEIQFRPDHVPETGLPPAAVSPAGEYDLVEHLLVDERVGGGRVSGEFALVIVDVDFPEDEVAPATLDVGGDQHVAGFHRSHEGRVEGHGGHRDEAAHDVRDGDDHRGIRRGHEDLSADDAARVAQVVRIRQAQCDGVLGD